MKFKLLTGICICFALLSNMSHAQMPKPSKIKNFALFLHDGVEILDFAGPMEVFIHGGFNVYTVGLDGKPIKAMRRLTILPDYSVDDFPTPDVAAFFGGGNAAGLASQKKYKTATDKMVKGAELQFSVCTGAFFLAETDRLNEMTATTYHSALGMLESNFPKVTVRKDVRYVDNGKVVTTAGISAGIDGALHLMARLRGTKVAMRITQNMEYEYWKPRNGLILESEFIKMVRKHGITKAIAIGTEKKMDVLFYQGELADIRDEFQKTGDTEKSEELTDYIKANF